MAHASSPSPAVAISQSDRTQLTRLMTLLLLINAVALLAGWSRRWPPDFLLASCGDILRWREAASMLIFGLLLMLLLWQLYRQAGASDDRRGDTAFIASVYLVGVGMGMHDPTNLLATVYANSATAPLLTSLRFFDDQLGHWVFWTGFVLGSYLIGARQVSRPLEQPMTWRWTAAFLLLSLPLFGVMLTNLMYEKTGVDLGVIGLAAGLILLAQIRGRLPLRRLPALCFIYPAYFGAIAGTLLYWAIGNH